MKVKIDATKCQGHLRCFKLVPEIFKVDKEGFAYVDQEMVSSDLQDRVRRAERACPERAVVIDEA